MDFPRSPSEFRRLLQARGLRPNKALGQCFLVDPAFLDAIVRGMGITNRDEVIEFGTGAGHLTSRLCDAAARVWSFEVDPPVCELAKELLRPRANLRLFCADAAEFEALARPDPAYRLVIVSNLPYSDYERLMIRALTTEMAVDACHFMIQADVYRRLRAGPGTAGYGPFGALLQGIAQFRLLRKAGPGLFHPRPRVESVFFTLRRRPDGVVARRQIPAVYRVLRGLFAHRRKLLKAALHDLESSRGRLPESVWKHGTKRVEALRPEALLELATTLAARDSGAFSPIAP
ncbi:MAG TPA: rRNA adenine dimethyltransferase family protein [Planctomycetota bacterium]|nr:rRNA adenine dimethyltransferase family protein [Planctomycetota bacterium]